MGLDAYVQCNCYKEGKAKPFPLPDLEKYLGMDGEGVFTLNLEYEGHEEAHQMFVEWKATACEHPNMDYVSERISNWSGYRAFQEALAELGWRHFPALEAELPALNGGSMSAQSAARALQELALFKEMIRQKTNIFLVNTETGEAIFEYIATYFGIFMWAGDEKLNFGFDKHGFFIAGQHPDSAVRPGQIFFQAMRLEQRLIDADEQGRRVEYFNADTEERFICRSVAAGTPDAYPRLLHVEERRLSADNFDYILKALTAVCQASVATGNPVVWC